MFGHFATLCMKGLTYLTGYLLHLWIHLFKCHSLKSVCIRSFSCPYFPAFRLNTERPEKLRIRTLFTQCVVKEIFHVKAVYVSNLMLNISGYIWSGGWVTLLLLILALFYLVLYFSISLFYFSIFLCLYLIG